MGERNETSTKWNRRRNKQNKIEKKIEEHKVTKTVKMNGTESKSKTGFSRADAGAEHTPHKPINIMIETRILKMFLLSKKRKRAAADM